MYYSEVCKRVIRARRSRERLLDMPISTEEEFTAIQNQLEAYEMCMDIEKEVLMSGHHSIWEQWSI